MIAGLEEAWRRMSGLTLATKLEGVGPVGKALLWIVAGIIALVIVGMVVISLVKALLSIAVYLIVGALVVGGGLFLYGRAKGMLRRGEGFKQLRR